MNVPYVPLDILKQRRSSLAALLPEHSLVVILSASTQLRNHDVEYPFRQDSSFWYVTGINQKDTAYVLYKNAQGEIEEKLYFVFQSVEQAKWSGEQMNDAELKRLSGIDTVSTSDTFEHDVDPFIKDAQYFYFDRNLHHQHPLFTLISDRPTLLPKVVLSQLRMCKDAWELEQMQLAADISIRAHKRAVKVLMQPHKYEYHIAAELEYEYTQVNCQWAYPSIVAGGANACTLHYVANNQLLVPGNLCLIDAGCEYNYYASDITRTYPINGKYTDAQKKIYEIVLAAQKAAIADIATADATMRSYHLAALNVLVQGLIDLKVLHGSVTEQIEKRSYQAYFNHGTGHFLGLDVHDMGIYKDENNIPTSLTPGTVVTVEPGLYFASNDHAVPQEFRGIGIRIEDDIVKTEQGIINLTQALPKETTEIESWMSL